MPSPEKTRPNAAAAAPNGNGAGLSSSPSAKPAPAAGQGVRPGRLSIASTRSSLLSAPAAAKQQHDDSRSVSSLDFHGSVDTNNELPSPETIRRIDNYLVLDRDGKSHTFRSLYTGRHAARRVLIIFVRHFFCGNCQDYLRTLSESITPESLLRLPLSTFIVVIGCGDPGLIDMYAEAARCRFPIYADPTRRLYAELGMVRSLALGERPAYARQSLLASTAHSVVQGLRQLPSGLALRGGDSKQVGGEFLFEPVAATAAAAAAWESGNEGAAAAEVAAASPVVEPAWDDVSARQRASETSLDGKGEPDEGEDKVVTWCHRMRTTRDHAEIPELMEVLGLDGHGRPVQDKERWERALRERKGIGVSLAKQMKAMKAEQIKASALEAGTV